MAARPARPGLHRTARPAAVAASGPRRVAHVARKKRFGQHFLVDPVE